MDGEQYFDLETARQRETISARIPNPGAEEFEFARDYVARDRDLPRGRGAFDINGPYGTLIGGRSRKCA